MLLGARQSDQIHRIHAQNDKHMQSNSRRMGDRVWQELATPALRDFLANGVAFRGKVKGAQLFAPTNQDDGGTLTLGRSRQHTEPRLENLLKSIASWANI